MLVTNSLLSLSEEDFKSHLFSHMEKILIFKMESFFPKFLGIKTNSSTQIQFKGRHLVGVTVATLKLQTKMHEYRLITSNISLNRHEHLPFSSRLKVSILSTMLLY